MIFNVCDCPACPCRADVELAYEICRECRAGKHCDGRGEIVRYPIWSPETEALARERTRRLWVEFQTPLTPAAPGAEERREG